MTENVQKRVRLATFSVMLIKGLYLFLQDFYLLSKQQSQRGPF